MSDPVGNAPRNPISGNSHKSREASPPPESEDPIEAVVVGKVTRQKQPFYRRATKAVFADDVQNVGEFIATDVLIPAMKNLLYDVVSQGSARVLFGTTRGARARSVGGGSSMSLKTAYHRASEPNGPREVSTSTRTRHAFDMIKLSERGEALDVLDRLTERVDRYGRASVADLYAYLGTTAAFTDRNWGWTNLDKADVIQKRDGFILDLPDPIDIR